MQPGSTLTGDQPDQPSGDQPQFSQNPGDQPAEAAAPWHYAQEGPTAGPVLSTTELAPVSWTASEFVEHEKSPAWFVGLGVVMLIIAAVIYLLTREVITTVVIVLAASMFGITAARKPRTLQYKVDSHGVHIGNKYYQYDLIKTFSVLEEGAFSSIQLMPLRRFMPPISLYYPPEHEDNIINMLASYLPHEERKYDPLDRLMRKIRF